MWTSAGRAFLVCSQMVGILGAGSWDSLPAQSVPDLEQPFPCNTAMAACPRKLQRNKELISIPQAEQTRHQIQHVAHTGAALVPARCLPAEQLLLNSPKAMTQLKGCTGKRNFLCRSGSVTQTCFGSAGARCHSSVTLQCPVPDMGKAVSQTVLGHCWQSWGAAQVTPI